MTINILEDLVIRQRKGREPIRTCSLPETIANLITEETQYFPALRPHQRHAWHAFLVQLCTMAMLNSGREEIPQSPEEWREIIAALTPEWPDQEPWMLSNQDITVPAFMQPPEPDPELEELYKNHTKTTPDDLDMLFSSKNHELKMSIARDAHPDDWLMSLITIQTCQGYSGPRSQAISRMNSGAGSRPAVYLSPNNHPGVQLRSAIQRLIPQVEKIAQQHDTRTNGIMLVWTIPWNGEEESELRMEDLHPLYIEVCRRVRLGMMPDQTVIARYATSKKRRIKAKEKNGITGDPWTPFDTRENKCLTISNRGFTSWKLVEYLANPQWDRPALLIGADIAGPGVLNARAIAGGNCQTNGYHDRSIPLHEKVIQALQSEEETKTFYDMARDRINKASAAEKTLVNTLERYLSAGKKVDSEDRKRTVATSNRLNALVDNLFFEQLQEEFLTPAGTERKEKNREWQIWLADETRKILYETINGTRSRTGNRYTAQARVMNDFERKIRDKGGLPEAFRPEAFRPEASKAPGNQAEKEGDDKEGDDDDNE